MSTTQAAFAALEENDLVALRKMIAAEPDLVNQRNEAGLSLVMLARYQGRAEALALLLQSQPVLDCFEAAALDDCERLEALLEERPELVSALSIDGYTALHLAAFFGSVASARMLLEQGSNVEAVSYNLMRVTPLHAAIAGAHAGVVDLLLTSGARVNVRQHGGWTPLHAAAEHGDPALAALLIARGADVKARLDSGQTAADVAAASGHVALVEQLGGETVAVGESCRLPERP